MKLKSIKIIVNINIYIIKLISYNSLGAVNINAEISFTLDVRLQISHLEMVINPVHHEVREPWGLPRCLEQFVE